MGIVVSTGAATYTGTAAARPGATTVPPGALYFATDTGALSRSNGTAWSTLEIGASSLLDASIGVSEFAAPQYFTASGTILATAGGEVVASSASAINLTLPAAIAGRRIRVTTMHTGGVQLDRAGSDVIGVSNTFLYVQGAPSSGKIGASVTLICRTNGTWIPLWAPGTPVTSGQSFRNTNGASGDVMSISVDGDGVTPMKIRVTGCTQTNLATQARHLLRIRDGAGGTGTSYAYSDIQVPANYAGVPITVVPVEAIIAPFTGAKTFYASYGTGSADTPTFVASAGNLATMTATWEPGRTT